MPDEAVVESVFGAMADPTRRHILDILARRGAISATVIADQLPVSRQAVVKHLGILDQAGLVSARRYGREVRYSVQAPALAVAGDWLTQLAIKWQGPDLASSAADAAAAAPVEIAPTSAEVPAAAPRVGALSIVPDLGEEQADTDQAAATVESPPERTGTDAPASIRADLAAALEVGTRLAGHLSDRLSRRVPRPLAFLLPRFLRR